MDVVIVVGIAGVWLALAGLYWQAHRRRAEEAPVDPGAESAADEAAVDLETREVDGAVELWWPGGGRLATVRLTEDAGRGSPLRSPWVRRAVVTMLRRAGKAAVGRGSARYRLTFPPDLMTSLASGGTVDVVLGPGSGIGTLGRGVGGAALGGPTLALAAGAVAMSVAQQQRLDRTLAVIEQRIDLVIDRMRDDDHGRLDAAEGLLHQLERRAADVAPAQLRAELAAARHSIDAIYFARRRFGQRLGDAIGSAQAAAGADGRAKASAESGGSDEPEADWGAAQAWAAGVLEAVGDPEQLRSELLVYLRALVVRARLATSTSGILAIDGDVEDANRLLAETVEELRTDFYVLYRRIRPLAQWAPRRALPWRRRDWDRTHTTVVEVYELMAGEVEPLLPDEHPKPVELEAVVDEHGDLQDLQILD